MKAILVLEDGNVYHGTGFGSCHDTLCEVVFNTGMCGYTELLTDPSYAGQGVVMTYPLMGNYGINYEDAESSKPWLKAFIVRMLINDGSNFRKDVNLDEYLKANNVAGLQVTDTRALTKHLREFGTMRGMIAYGENVNVEEVLQKVRAFEMVTYVPTVSGAGQDFYNATCEEKYKVALIDYGVKQNIVRSLQKRGCSVKVFPHDVSAQEVLDYKPDGIMLSNGPSDPKDCPKSIETLKGLCATQTPIFAICLGHQLMALAHGADSHRLKYGHRGINHPVKDLADNKVYITSQNHGYVIDADTVNPEVADVTFISMNDNSVEGLTYKKANAFSVQFHPEASPGPLDTGYLFDRFIKMMDK